MQLVFALSAATVVSGCRGSSTEGTDWHGNFAKGHVQNLAIEYSGFIATHNKPPTSLEELIKNRGYSDFSEIKDAFHPFLGVRDGRYIVIWNVEPGKQDPSSEYYILAYEAKPGPNGKRWVGRIKQVGPQWTSADPVELTEEEFQKAPKVKPSS
jgi:hypothetical protein